MQQNSSCFNAKNINKVEDNFGVNLKSFSTVG